MSASLIGGGADDGVVSVPGHDDRVAAQRGIVTLLDGGKEGIHVDVRDLAQGRRGGQLGLGLVMEFRHVATAFR